MPVFIMLTRLSSEAVRSPKSLEELERQAMQRIDRECPEVKWWGSYAVLGPCDYLDIFEAPDVETATKVSTLIPHLWAPQTEIWAATEWARFKDLVRGLGGTEATDAG